MIIHQQIGAALKLKNPTGLQMPGFKTYFQPEQVLIDGGQDESVEKNDVLVTTQVPVVYYEEGAIVVEGVINQPVFRSLSDHITVNPSGRLIRTANDAGAVLVTCGTLTKRINIPFFDVGERQADPEIEWLPGSLGQHLAESIDSLIQAYTSETAPAAKTIFSVQNHAAGLYTRNTDCWAYGLDLTCCSPWNSYDGPRRAGTLVTPRHVLGAAHYQYPVGTQLRFVTMDNQVLTRTVTGLAVHPNYAPYYPDLTIYTLDSALPESITPVKILPSDWNSKLVEISLGRPPALGLDQEEKALIMDTYFFTAGASFEMPRNSKRLLFHEWKIGGDSGNPAFSVINGEVVLLTLWTYGGAGGGTFITPHLSTLNAMIATADAQAGISTGLEMQTVDISEFEDYS